MIILLSPAKTLDMTPVDCESTQPRLLEDTMVLANDLRGKSREDIARLMKVSDKLADLNYRRYQDFSDTFDRENSAPAGYAFRGDVYQDLEFDKFDPRQRELANRQIRILSGLYGLLRPLDLMQPYRLEMGTRLKNDRGSNLYEFWGDRITDLINEDLAQSGDDTILNLASKEYFSCVNADRLAGRLLNIHFKEKRDGKLRVIAFNAKKARGRLARLITLEGLTSPEAVKEFAVNGYQYDEAESGPNDWTFVK